jgi:hypothetical protein
MSSLEIEIVEILLDSFQNSLAPSLSPLHPGNWLSLSPIPGLFQVMGPFLDLCDLARVLRNV